MSEPTLKIHLPKPVSVNRIWRKTSSGMILSTRYKKWKESADTYWVAQTGGKRSEVINGPFTARVTISMAVRRRGEDIDNLGKCVMDWLERSGFIRNDSNCESITIRWGDNEIVWGGPSECIVEIWEFKT